MGKERISLAKAFKCALDGIVHAFREGRNFKIECVIGIIAVILGFVCSIDATQWAVVIVCIGVVLGLETLNTSIEAIVDLVSPDYHELAKHAKDCAAGAVLLCSIAAFIVACFIYLPPLWNMLVH